MPLVTCEACQRRFQDDGSACPYCGGKAASPASSKGGYRGGDSQDRMKKAAVVVGVLLAFNAWFLLTRDDGPDPEGEALHSEAEAVGVCTDAVLSQLSARSPSILGVGRTDYLQGGEYEVRLPVALRTGPRRTESEVLCQLQFTAETGWAVEDVSVDPN